MPPRGSKTGRGRRNPAQGAALPNPPQTPPRNTAQQQFTFDITTQEDLTAQLAAVPPGSDEDQPTQPPVFTSPVKKKHRKDNINRLTDLKAWNLSDEEILSMHRL
jgi:hypothetical protein